MVILSRSLAPLIRTSRLAVRQHNGVNPVQQVFGKDAIGVRGLATVFERSKPHVNIGAGSRLYIGKEGRTDLYRNNRPR
jgi:elongation factor Tu